MSTPDIKPNRLARAKLAIDDFANQLDGDAVGIVAFAGSAFLVCPITLDYGAFHESLNAIDTHTIPRGRHQYLQRHSRSPSRAAPPPRQR